MEKSVITCQFYLNHLLTPFASCSLVISSSFYLTSAADWCSRALLGGAYFTIDDVSRVWWNEAELCWGKKATPALHVKHTQSFCVPRQMKFLYENKDEDSWVSYKHSSKHTVYTRCPIHGKKIINNWKLICHSCWLLGLSRQTCCSTRNISKYTLWYIF